MNARARAHVLACVYTISVGNKHLNCYIVWVNLRKFFTLYLSFIAASFIFFLQLFILDDIEESSEYQCVPSKRHHRNEAAYQMLSIELDQLTAKKSSCIWVSCQTRMMQTSCDNNMLILLLFRLKVRNTTDKNTISKLSYLYEYRRFHSKFQLSV